MTTDAKPPAGGGGGGKKEFPWGVMIGVFLGIILIATAISFGAESLYGSRNAIEWVNDFARRLLGTVLILLIIAAVVKMINKP